MPDTIRDGKGRGHLMGVGSDNRALINAVTETAERHANEEGKAYHMLFDKTPTGANDCFLYMKNTEIRPIIVEGVWLRVGSAEQVLVKLGDTGTLINGTTTAPVNINSGTNNTASGTFETGVNITGLSGGVVIEKYWLENTETKHFNFEQDVIVEKNGVFTLYAVTGGINVAGTVVFNYYEEVY